MLYPCIILTQNKWCPAVGVWLNCIGKCPTVRLMQHTSNLESHIIIITLSAMDWCRQQIFMTMQVCLGSEVRFYFKTEPQMPSHVHQVFFCSKTCLNPLPQRFGLRTKNSAKYLITRKGRSRCVLESNWSFILSIIMYKGSGVSRYGGLFCVGVP